MKVRRGSGAGVAAIGVPLVRAAAAARESVAARESEAAGVGVVGSAIAEPTATEAGNEPAPSPQAPG